MAIKHVKQIVNKINNIQIWRIKFYGIAIIIALFWSGLGLAQSNGHKLENLMQKITEVKTDLKQTQQKHSNVKDQIRAIDLKISKLEKKHRTTESNLKRHRQILQKLTSSQIEEQNHLYNTESIFTAQIIDLYHLDDSPPLKTILNQDDGSKYDRLITYHRHILAARINLMHNIDSSLKRLQANKQLIKNQTKILVGLESDELAEKHELEVSKNERNRLLASLGSKIQVQSKKLQELLQSKAKLEKLIVRLNLKKRVIKTPQSMAQLCRNFTWPTPGNIKIHFDSPIENSSWRWNGILINAPLGQTVQAAVPGKVVYAGVLASYGLLLIIDHENGYMSLYGHAQNLYKKVNDQVMRGEKIATVGQSGSSEEPELYFGLRYNGQPVDPEKCQQ